MTARSLALVAAGFVALVGPIAGCGDDAPEPDATGAFEATETTVSSLADGRLEALTADEGDLVAAGDVVGLVDTTQLAAQRDALVAQVRQVRGQQQSLRAQARAARVGAEAALAQGSATLVGADEAAAGARVLTAQLATAREELARTRRLHAGGAATARELNEREGAVAALAEQERQAQARVGSVRAQAGTAGATARVQSAQAEVPDAQADALDDQVAALDVQIAALNDRIANAAVVNPAAGTVLTVLAEPGETVRVGTPLYTVADLSSLRLRAYATGDQLARLRLGAEVEVRVDDGAGGLRAIPGRVTAVASEAQFTPTPIQTRDTRAGLVYAFDVRVPNPEGRLRIGMPGEVRLP